jgi:hypothetical protein
MENAMDENFWAEVERAKRMSPSEKISEGLRLRDEWWAQLLVEIKSEFPGISDNDAIEIRRKRWEDESRHRSAEKSRILEMIYAKNAAQRAGKRT